jgi:hypothetical protein
MSDILNEGAILLSLVIAGVLTFVLGGIALILLQRAIARHMAASGGRPAATPAERPRRAANAPLVFAVDNAATATRGLAERILRRLAAAHVAAGLTFAIIATVMFLLSGGMELLPVRTTVVLWAFAWPTVLVLSLLVGPDRPLQGLIFLGYFGGLFVLCGVAWLIGTTDVEVVGVTVPGIVQPFFLWLAEALPSLFLLLFLNRTIRSIGPLVLVFVFVVLFGSYAALALLALPWVLDSLPVFPLAHAIGGDGLFWGFAGVGMLVAGWLAWRLVAFLRDRYAAKRSSELLLTIGAIWLFETLLVAQGLSREWGVAGIAAAAVPLVAWWLALHTGLRPLVAAARRRPPSRLLLLRVFGFGRRSRRLLDLLGTRWRLIGSIDLIAAPDLASRTIEPSTFLEFIRGRLARLFIRTPEQLQERLAALDHQPDPDARFRVNQLYCSDDMWRDGVTRLMGEASLVAMDLRGFGAHRRGCVYELQTLLDTVPISRLVFLFDRSTDLRALETLLTAHWQQVDAASPNLAARNPTLRLLDASGSETQVVRRLLVIAEAPRPVIDRRQ